MRLDPQVRGAAAAFALAVGGASLVAVAWDPAPPPTPAAVRAADVPLTLAGYTSPGDRPGSADLRAVLPGADIHDRLYRRGPAAMAFTLIAGAHGVALHDPRLCLGGLQLSNPRTERLAGTPVAMQVYDASTRPGTPPDEMVAYFYVDGGRVISSPSQIRVSLFWGDLLGRPGAPVYFFRFIQPLDVGADARLRRFAGDAWRPSGPKWRPLGANPLRKHAAAA